MRYPTNPRTVWNLTRRKAVRVLPPSPSASGVRGDCLLLHGWHADAGTMREIERALMALPEAQGWRFRLVEYDTHWQSFGTTARQLAAALGDTARELRPSVLVGYSMGGIVARQMVASGFPCRALVTICSPHLGLAPWLPTPDPGTASLAPWSRALAALNRSPVDIERRDRYHFFAINYSDVRGSHRHDGLVQERSALGEGLDGVASRQAMHLRYRGLATADPHWRGMYPHYIAPVLARCAELFEGG